MFNISSLLFFAMKEEIIISYIPKVLFVHATITGSEVIAVLTDARKIGLEFKIIEDGGQIFLSAFGIDHHISSVFGCEPQWSNIYHLLRQAGIHIPEWFSDKYDINQVNIAPPEHEDGCPLCHSDSYYEFVQK